jgi:hypothetical protein
MRWITRSGNGNKPHIYHSDPDCHQLALSEYREIPDDHPALMDRRECKYCAGETNGATGGDKTIYKKALRASEHERL